MLTHFSSVIMRVRDLDVEKRASVGQSGEGREPSQSCPGRGEGGAPNTRPWPGQGQQPEGGRSRCLKNI